MHLLPYGAYVAETAGGNHQVVVNESHLHDLIRSVLNGVEFDEQWYRQRYRDVENAIQAGEFESGFDHYSRVGYFEGRMPRSIPVDEDWYTGNYADVKSAIRRGKVDNAQDHFETYGFSEGRLPRQSWAL